MTYKSNFWHSYPSYVLIIALFLIIAIYIGGLMLTNGKALLMAIAFSGCIIYNLNLSNYLVIGQGTILINNYFIPWRRKKHQLSNINKISLGLDKAYYGSTIKLNISENNFCQYEYSLGYVRKKDLQSIVSELLEYNIEVTII